MVSIADQFYEDVMSEISEEKGLTRITSDIDGLLTEASVEMFEDHYVTEKTEKTIVGKIKEFFAKLVASIKSFVKTCINRFTDLQRSVKYRTALRNAKERLLKEREEGKTTTEIIDIWSYKQLYKDLNSDVWKYVKRFERCNYKTEDAVDADLKNFDKLLEAYDARLEEASSKKCVKYINEAIRFIDEQLRSRSNIMTELNAEIARFEDLKNRADAFETKFNIAGMDAMDEKTGIMRKIFGKVQGAWGKLLSWIKKQVLKVMTVGIFLFA